MTKKTKTRRGPQFDESNRLGVLEFAKAFFARIERRHPRRSGEKPADYFFRVSQLPDIDRSDCYHLGGLHGLIAGLGESVDELLSTPEEAQASQSHAGSQAQDEGVNVGPKDQTGRSFEEQQ